MKTIKNVTIVLNTKLYDKYRKHCKKEGLVLSKQIENFIKEETDSLNTNTVTPIIGTDKHGDRIYGKTVNIK